MGVKKIIISPDNTKAIKFFEDLDRKKAEYNKKTDAKLTRIIAAKKLVKWLFPNYYSYIKEEDNDVEYTFYSALNDIIYNVTFSIDDYSSYWDNFSTLLQNGYSFGFRSKKFSSRKRVQDDLVFATIYKIMSDFMENVGKETVLLYHCDTSDNRQSYRNKLFNNWEKLVTDTQFYKHSIEAEIQKPGHSTTANYYFGFITFLDNPQLDTLKQEFESFSYYIIEPKED